MEEEIFNSDEEYGKKEEKEEEAKYAMCRDEFYNLYHTGVVTANSPEEFQENLNDMTTYIQCEQKGNIDDIKLAVNGIGGNITYTALITYYHTLYQMPNENEVVFEYGNEDEE